MNSIAIRSFAELEQAGLEQAAQVFADSYGDALVQLSRDPAVLTQIIRHAFVPGQFYAAVDTDSGRVVGIMGCSTNRTRCLSFDRNKLKRSAGAVKGGIFYRIFARLFHTPHPIGDDECFIEAVATAPAARGRGVATALLRHFLERLPYRTYYLEVVDTNESAIRLYRKHGFATIRTKKQRFFRKRSGFNETYYMSRTVEKP